MIKLQAQGMIPLGGPRRSWQPRSS
jgi:hypothetical protein